MTWERKPVVVAALGAGAILLAFVIAAVMPVGFAVQGDRPAATTAEAAAATSHPVSFTIEPNTNYLFWGSQGVVNAELNTGQPIANLEFLRSMYDTTPPNIQPSLTGLDSSRHTVVIAAANVHEITVPTPTGSMKSADTKVYFTVPTAGDLEAYTWGGTNYAFIVRDTVP